MLDDTHLDPTRRLQQEKQTLYKAEINARNFEAQPLKQQVVVVLAAIVRRGHDVQQVRHIAEDVKHERQCGEVEERSE
jgi:hypothetical protein